MSLGHGLCNRGFIPTYAESCRKIVEAITTTSSRSQVHIHLDFQSSFVIIIISIIIIITC